MRKQTALYLRVSTSEQSTEAQRSELEAYSTARRWSDVSLYEDIITGASTSRPQFDLMMNHARCGKLARILVVKLDRLGRSLAHIASRTAVAAMAGCDESTLFNWSRGRKSPGIATQVGLAAIFASFRFVEFAAEQPAQTLPGAGPLLNARGRARSRASVAACARP